MAPDEKFSTSPVLTSAKLMYGPISNEKMVSAHFHSAFSADIRRRLNEGVALPFGDNGNRTLCHQATHDQFVILYTLKQRVLLIHHYARFAGHPDKKTCTSLFVNDVSTALAVEY